MTTQGQKMERVGNVVMSAVFGMMNREFPALFAKAVIPHWTKLKKGGITTVTISVTGIHEDDGVKTPVFSALGSFEVESEVWRVMK